MRTPGGEEHDAEPAHGVTVERPKVDAVGVCRQIGLQQPDQSESCDHPAVVTVLAFAGTEISAAEQRNTGEHEEHDRKRDQGRMREEGGKAA
jgi:hypothetical protein